MTQYITDLIHGFGGAHHMAVGSDHHKIRYTIAYLIFAEQVLIARFGGTILLPRLRMFLHGGAPSCILHIYGEVDDLKVMAVFLADLFYFRECCETLPAPTGPEINEQQFGGLSAILGVEDCTHYIGEMCHLVGFTVYLQVNKWCTDNRVTGVSGARKVFIPAQRIIGHRSECPGDAFHLCFGQVVSPLEHVVDEIGGEYGLRMALDIIPL